MTSSCSRFSTVGCDQAAGVRAAVDYLLALGHQTVHLVSGPAYSRQAAVRRQAWQECLETNDCDVPDVVVGDWTASSGCEAARHLKAAGATAVVASNDEMAAGLIIGLLDMGVRVPEDVSVVGFDDILGNLVWPTLTTVRQDFAAIGQRLATDDGGPHPLRSPACEALADSPACTGAASEVCNPGRSCPSAARHGS